MAMIARQCEDVTVTVVDINAERIAAWESDELPVFEPELLETVQAARGRNLFFSIDVETNIREADVIFISVNTPTKTYGVGSGHAADLRYVEICARRIAEIGGGDKIVVEKSTVPVRTAHMVKEILGAAQNGFEYQVVSNPEFLRESTTPNEDFANQETVVIGTDEDSTYKLTKKMFEKVLLPSSDYYNTSLAEAEMIKCAQNTMLASRVALANMIYDACEDNNLEYQKVKEIAFDRFEILGPYMTQVPGPDGNRGFGGKCLPKDIRGFSTVHDSKIIKEIISYNNNLRTDLENFLLNYSDQ